MLVLSTLGWGATGHAAERMLVRDGQPQACIVIAAQPPRMVQLAAEELQTYVQRISGAKLEITTAPRPELPLTVYVGVSPHTQQLGLSDADLPDGAYRIIARDNWLALLGHDADYAPIEPWARNHPDQQRARDAWDQITGAKWGNGYGPSIHRIFNKSLGFWGLDERGSLNAVYAFLRNLGVRWYMPGPLGEILPQQTSIAMPTGEHTVHPDFGLRYQHHSFFSFNNRDDILWYLRLGMNSGSHAIGWAMIHSHGLTEVIERAELRQAHPEYYALWGGQRRNDEHPKPCLSSPGLLEETVRYLRAFADTYHLPMVSVMPPDGYSNACQCPLCAGKSTPERGWSGQISDYVWDYVNRVAIELYKTHPDVKVTCFAYGTYLLPPTKIDHLSPNVVVGIVQPRRMFNDAALRQQNLDLRQQWLAKAQTPRLLIWDHYPFTLPGRPSHGLPQYFPRLIAQDLRALKGISYGEIIEAMFDPQKQMGIHAPIFNHLNIYVTARCYWNADLDLDALLGEYYRLFYGPAAAAMQTLVDYCEANSAGLFKDPQVMRQALDYADAALAQTAADTVYRQRLEQLIAYLQPLREKSAQLALGRQNVPEARIRAVDLQATPLTLDGQLDDPAWEKLPAFGLADLVTGKPAQQRTTFKMLWANDALYVAVRCFDEPGGKPNIATTRSEDAGIWQGDVVELLLETTQHSYYQLAVNPAGAVMDLDRITGREPAWTAQAQVATQIGAGEWTLEMRIPVVDPAGGQLDPLHGVVGRKPTEWYPWYINVCRQRVRDSETELSAWSPTGQSNFHEVLKFGKLYVR